MNGVPLQKPQRTLSSDQVAAAAAREVGARFKDVRETAELDLQAAAKSLDQPIEDLRALEAGSHPPTVDLLMRAARVYGCTTDFILGLAEDSDRDPASSLLRHMSARLHADITRLTAATAEVNVQALRQLLPVHEDCQHLARAALDAKHAHAVLRDRNHLFDEELWGGAMVVSTVENAAALAQTVIDQMARAKRLLAMRQTQASALLSPDSGCQFQPLLPVMEML